MMDDLDELATRAAALGLSAEQLIRAEQSYRRVFDPLLPDEQRQLLLSKMTEHPTMSDVGEVLIPEMLRVGPVERIEDLTKIDGIGPKRLMALTQALAHAQPRRLIEQLQPQSWTMRDKAQKSALTADILFAAGGAAVATSLVLFYLEYKKETRELRAKDDGNNLSIGVNVAREGGGISLKGRF